MKKFISLFVVAAAAVMVSCGGNTQPTEVVDSVAIVETVVCDSVACDSTACDSVCVK